MPVFLRLHRLRGATAPETRRLLRVLLLRLCALPASSKEPVLQEIIFGPDPRGCACPEGLRGRALPSRGLLAIFDIMQRLDLTDNERAVLITALRRLVDFDPRSLSPQTDALNAILERLEPHKPQPIPDTASTG